MAFVVNLENCTEPVLKCSKTGISTLESCSGEIVGETGLVRPTIKVQVSDPSVVEGANYFSISGDIVRHFFITEKRSLTNNLWLISGKADLRYTFATAIKSSSGIVARNESFYNMYIPDGKIPTYAQKTLNIYKFSGQPFTLGAGTIILMTAGGL